MKGRERAHANRFPGEEERPRRGRRRLITGGRVVAVLACLFGGTIIVNAVMMQNEKHPTPLFRNAIRQAESFPTPPVRPETTPRSAATPTTPASPPAPAAATATRPRRSRWPRQRRPPCRRPAPAMGHRRPRRTRCWPICSANSPARASSRARPMAGPARR